LTRVERDGASEIRAIERPIDHREMTTINALLGDIKQDVRARGDDARAGRSGAPLGLGRFGLGQRVGATRVERLLEAAPEDFSFEENAMTRPPRLEPHHPHGLVPAAVAPCVALRFAQGAQPSHGWRLGAVSDDPACREKGSDPRV
jgi:hypothetical protein